MEAHVTALVLLLALASSPPIVWLKVTEPMERVTWSLVDDIGLVDPECRSDNALPRVCLYRHRSRCRIITTAPPRALPPRTVEQLLRMCAGYFPEPVLLLRKFSDPNYLPNQAPPAVDPAWKYQNGVRQ